MNKLSGGSLLLYQKSVELYLIQGGNFKQTPDVTISKKAALREQPFIELVLIYKREKPKPNQYMIDLGISS